MQNRWEWLHRINTTMGLLGAIFGGSAVTGVLHAVGELLARPTLPWWGYMVVSAVFSALFALVLLRARWTYQREHGAPTGAGGAPYHGDDTGLKIESAMMGAQGIAPIDVTDRIRRWISKGDKAIPVNWSLFLPRDPHEHFYKFLTVTFSLTEMEGRAIPLPLAPGQASLRVDGADASPPALGGIPHLLINYAGGLRQALTFINDGEATAIIKKIGPLSWEEHRTLSLWGPVPPVPAGGREERQILFESSPGSGSNLYDYLRSSTPADAEARVNITFEDSRGNVYNQSFTLTTMPPRGDLVWQPGPVERVSSGAAI